MMLRTEPSDRIVRTCLRITATHIIFTCISCTLFVCDMYMCRLRHINDPVLSSLKMEGIRLLYIQIFIFLGNSFLFLLNYSITINNQFMMSEDDKCDFI
jgi:hypothetical protein